MGYNKCVTLIDDLNEGDDLSVLTFIPTSKCSTRSTRNGCARLCITRGTMAVLKKHIWCSTIGTMSFSVDLLVLGAVSSLSYIHLYAQTNGAYVVEEEYDEEHGSYEISDVWNVVRPYVDKIDMLLDVYGIYYPKPGEVRIVIWFDS